MRFASPQPHSAPRRLQTAVIVLLLLACVGLLGRLVVAALSIGTNDAMTFAEFGKEIRFLGLLGTYRNDVYYNHPPLIGLWAATVLRLIHAPGAPLLVAFSIRVTWLFSFLFKLPFIAADFLGTWLLFQRWRGKTSTLRAAAIACAFAWCLGSAAIGAYHGNTDPAYAALALLAVWLMEDRRKFFWAGVALGAAINVKIIPGLLVAPLLLSCRTRNEARRFILGLALAALPFLPPLLLDFATFRRNVLGYSGFVDSWGINFVLMNLGRLHRLAEPTARLVQIYHSLGAVVILTAVVAWAVVARRLQRWNRYEIAAVTFCLFLLLSPSFGVQYTVPAALLLFAVRPGIALIYSLLDSTLLAIIYLGDLCSPRLPWISLLTDRLTFGQSLLAFAMWLLLAYFVGMTIARPRGSRAKAKAPAGHPIEAPYTSARAA